ncbi:hypothetical protein K9M79_06490 [Candidatus Woesearchaeota archaeon]|nr:hypothetical protein [Candidatus Woesearchaeota archaeon]
MSYSKILLIADEARRSIGEFCNTECHAYCCRKGYLILNAVQVDLVTQNKCLELTKSGSLKVLENGNYSLFLGDESCPSLSEGKCLIHQNQKRPDACKQFPLFLVDYRIKLSQRCMAVRIGKFYPFISTLIKLGCTLEKNDFNDFGYESFFKLEKHEKRALT